ncbi:MAG: DUF1826 domain-containing protein [Bacteroidota bacterium]
MKTTASVQNWAIGTTPDVLENIHQKDINIAVYERDLTEFEAEIEHLLEQNIELKLSGDAATIHEELKKAIDPNTSPQITQDILDLVDLFKGISGSEKIRLLLATINVNMCRKFHTDVNDIRMLCTYSGPGTLWLTEDNINRNGLGTPEGNASIVIDEGKIQQAKTGAAILLKGAIYPKEGTKAVVHRSPTIEESGERRLLLRVDTGKFRYF